MIKTTELREFYPVVRYQEGNGISLQAIAGAIQHAADQKQIPVAFYSDRVKSGNPLAPNFEDCLVLYHPDHRTDYYKICIRVSYQGSYAFVKLMDFGNSAQGSKFDREEAMKQDRRGKSVSYKIGSLVSQKLITLGKSQAKYDAENTYYVCLHDIFDEVFK